MRDLHELLSLRQMENSLSNSFWKDLVSVILNLDTNTLRSCLENT